MREHEIACMYYPTTVIAIDDNPSILQNIELKLGRIFPVKTFQVPEEALKYIQKTVKKENALEGIININEDSSDYSHDAEQLPFSYDVSKIYKNTYKKDHYSDVSVILVDFAMPGMNGEALCRKLRMEHGSLVKIIMLTGEANDPKAIELFNSGIIDRFMRKSQEGVDEALVNCIIEMKNLYFKDLTSPIFKGMLSEKSSALGDAAFAKLFNDICRKISATSYYLIEISGSFIFFNNAGKPTWLIIKTLEELKEIADQIEPDISERLVNSIANGEVIPYFRPSEFIEYYSNEERLKKSLHPAQKLEGEQVYYYAVLNELAEFPLDREKIVSFDRYMSSL